MKRPRSDFGKLLSPFTFPQHIDSYAPSLLEINNACRLVEAPSSTMTIGHGGGYYPRDEDLDVPDTRTIGSAYDRYLQSVVPFFLASFSVHSSFFIDLKSFFFFVEAIRRRWFCFHGKIRRRRRRRRR